MGSAADLAFVKRTFAVIVIVLHSAGSIGGAWGCTTAVISGKATADGRPILWKNRDTKSKHNEVVVLDDGPLKAVAIVNAGSRKSVWMGANEAGFCIENSLSKDLASSEKTEGPHNGHLMKEALQTCSTVGDFQKLLDKTNPTGRVTTANFGVIDACGGAALFETGPKSYQMFDANDPQVAPSGYIVRSNFAMTARDLPANPKPEQVESLYSGERYLRACSLLESGGPGKVALQYVIRNLTRDLSDEKGRPYRGTVNGDPGALPPVIPTSSTISRTTTVSAAIFHGVRPDENPRLTTMWAILGDPKFSIAVPCWVGADEVADPLTDDRGGEIGEIAITLRDGKLTMGRDSVFTEGLSEIWKDLWSIEDGILDETIAARDRWSDEGLVATELTELHHRVAARAMAAMQAELRKAKEGALAAPTPSIPDFTRTAETTIEAAAP